MEAVSSTGAAHPTVETIEAQSFSPALTLGEKLAAYYDLTKPRITFLVVLSALAGFAIASVLFTVLLVAGLAFGGWLWWQLRRLARRARKAHPEFIEGEYTVVSDQPLLERQQAPVATPRRSPRRVP